MTVAIEGYQTSIVSEDGHPEKLEHVLVEHQGKLTDDILEAIKDDVSSRYAWVYAQSQISRLKVRIKSITTLSRMHSIEEYDCVEFFVEDRRGDL